MEMFFLQNTKKSRLLFLETIPVGIAKPKFCSLVYFSLSLSFFSALLTYIALNFHAKYIIVPLKQT
jgi:hypothetical protein